MSTQIKRKQYCTFQLGNLDFGVEVLNVQEVMLQPTITSVPLAPPVVRGLMNLRGQIVPSIDLRERLELPADSDRLPMCVVLTSDDGPVSLLVDQIGDVVEIGEEAFEPTPATVQGETRKIVAGVYKLEKRLLLVLDVERALTFELETSGAA
jgi:purine-binding chemotaxis protein CheW